MLTPLLQDRSTPQQCKCSEDRCDAEQRFMESSECIPGLRYKSMLVKSSRRVFSNLKGHWIRP